MRYLRQSWWRGLLVVVLLASVLPVVPARAQLEPCDIDFSPHSVAPGSDNMHIAGPYNSSPDPVLWVKVTRPPGGRVTLETAEAAGWTADVQTDTVTFTGGSLPSNSSQVFGVQALAASSGMSPANWTFEMSDNADGSGAIACTGDLSFEIAVQPSVINLSNVSVTNVGPTSATVTWDTDVASNSQVAYGADSTYGSQTVLQSALVTSHSIALIGLTANSTYHFAVTSATPADGGTATSGDNTLITAVQQAPVIVNVPAPSSGGGLSGSNVPGVTVQVVPTESTPPTVQLATNLTAPFKVVPLISGAAADNVAVARVDYSVDGGRNWLPVDKIEAGTTTATSGKGKKKQTTTVIDPTHITFSFTPVLTEDGDYLVMARAIDSSGNQAMTQAVKLVIDRLPPRFGAEVVSVGSQVAVPDSAGRLRSVVDIDETLTMNAVGGPVQASVQALPGGAKTGGQTFALRRDPLSGLWSGTLSFHIPGLYNLTVLATDGAGNKTSRDLAQVLVSAAARLNGDGAKPVSGGKVTLYYRQPKTDDWVLWDAASYGQINPQRTDKAGSFQLLVPAGTYYMKVEAPGHQTLVSRQFKVTTPTPLTPTLRMSVQPHLTIGSWKLYLPWVSLARTEIVPAATKTGVAVSTLVGHALPSFTLPSTKGGTVSTIGLLGKPTVVTVLASWAPTSSEQLAALAKLATNNDIQVVPVVTGERLGRVQAFLGRSGYDLPVAVDADAELNATIGIPNVPTHYLVDRKGIVRAVTTGVTPAAQLVDRLGGF